CIDKNNILIEIIDNKIYTRILKYNKFKSKVLIDNNIIEYYTDDNNDTNTYTLVYKSKQYIFNLSSDKVYSPTSGKITNILVKDNETVIINQKYMEIEIMKIRVYLEVKKEGKIKILKKINDKIDKGEVIAIINNNCDMDNNGNNDKPNNNLFDNSINNYTWKDNKDTNYSKLLLYGIYFPEYYWYIPTNIEEIIDIINIYSINNKGKEYFTKVINEAINLFEDTITNNSNYSNNSDKNNLINDNHDNSNNIMNIKLSRLNLLLLSIDKIITKYIDDNIIKLRDLLIDIIFKRLVYKYKNNNNKKNSFCYVPDIYLYSNRIDNIDNLTYSDSYPYILYNNKLINKEEEEIIIRNLKEYYNTSNIFCYYFIYR
ncbi:Biotin-requiring enzyme, partial [Spraguea lophii 42_110]